MIKKIVLLTSSRADYAGIEPLLKELKRSNAFDFSIIAFGTHASAFHGNTKSLIIKDGYNLEYVVETMILGDSPESISACMGLTTIKFSNIWANNTYDLIIATGDRYEMYAAVLAAVPFNIPIAHIHGGEDTEGATDNIFRHSLSLMATYHFTTTDLFKERVAQIKKSAHGVYSVGALSIDAMKATKFLTPNEFIKKFNVNIQIPFVLVTFHPETASLKKNEDYIIQFISALKNLSSVYQLVITMPNADAMGSMYRQKLNEFIAVTPSAKGIESFGNQAYFTAMKHCKFMLGNSSSGFVEASFFPKYVINVGNRQKGRIITSNIINCENSKKDIINAVKIVEKSKVLSPINEYGKGNTAAKIVEILENIK